MLQFLFFSKFATIFFCFWQDATEHFTAVNSLQNRNVF